MRLIFKITIKILIFFLLLLIPTALFIAFFSLNQRDIPLWNIGIRNTITMARNYSIPIVFVSYLVSTLLAVSLVDKTKVKSLLGLHIPPIIVGAILICIIYFTASTNVSPLNTKGAVQIGYRTFLRENVFNTISDTFLYYRKSDQNLYNLYIYDKNNNDLEIAQNISIGDSLYVNHNKRELSIKYKEKNTTKSLNIPYKRLSYKSYITRNRLILFYSRQVRSVIEIIRAQFEKLPKSDAQIFAISMLFSVILISIPLTYALNDKGWGFLGIIAVFVIIFILPLLYGAIFKIFKKLNLSLLGNYSYLFPSLVFCSCGIIIDILIKTIGSRSRTP